MSKEKNLTEEVSEGTTVYELGFHFVPTIAEDAVAPEFSNLKSLIEKRGGEFISEDFPKLFTLAYKISKTLKAQKKWYDKSYFGWVKFTLTPEAVIDLKKEVDGIENVLRYMIIKTVKENTLIAPKIVSGRGGAKISKKDKEVAGPINEVELDKTIEELVTE